METFVAVKRSESNQMNMDSTKILLNRKRLPTPILFGLNIPAVVHIQLSELRYNLMDESTDKAKVCLLAIFSYKCFRV